MLINAGIHEDAVDAALGEDEPAQSDGGEDLELWPENKAVYVLFCSLATQWHILSGFGFVRYVGLRYCAAETRMRAARMKNRDALFDDLHVMELAALPELNRAKDE